MSEKQLKKAIVIRTASGCVVKFGNAMTATLSRKDAAAYARHINREQGK
jgi:hypothetical protein